MSGVERPTLTEEVAKMKQGMEALAAAVRIAGEKAVREMAKSIEAVRQNRPTP